MRGLIFLLLILSFGLANSETGKTGEIKKESAAEQRGTNDSPLVVKIFPTPKTTEETQYEQKERNEKADNDRKLVQLTGDLAHYTEELATFTKVLAFFGFLQLVVFGYQSLQLKRTVDSTEDANAPYVFPELSEINVFRKSADHLPIFNITLSNHGKTPAIMRRSKFELHVLDKIDGRPRFTDSAVSFSTNEVISGEKVGPFIWKYKFHRTLTPNETERLQKRIDDPQQLRFFLTGEVEYDDFFGFTHTKGYCFKLFNNGTYLVKNYPGYAYSAKSKTSRKIILPNDDRDNEADA